MCKAAAAMWDVVFFFNTNPVSAGLHKLFASVAQDLAAFASTLPPSLKSDPGFGFGCE